MKAYNTVKDLQNENIAFVCDSQDVVAVKSLLPPTQQCYDSYFVNIANGEYSRLFGMFGIVPWHTRRIYQLI